MSVNLSKCPLCHTTEIEQYHQDRKRQYWQCNQCLLVFVPGQYHLSDELEKAEYDKHDNLKLDEGYRRFLNRTLKPLLPTVKSRFGDSPKGLDFGCGEGRHLSTMAREQGAEMSDYDFYYYDHPENLIETYDFVTLTEVIEHLADARNAWLKLKSLLNPGGVLAVMTKRVIDRDAFSRWHYKNDPTHISFYSEQTFRFTANWLNMELRIVADDVVFLMANS